MTAVPEHASKFVKQLIVNKVHTVLRYAVYICLTSLMIGSSTHLKIPDYDLCSTGVRPAPDISFRLIVETLWRYDVTFRLIILILFKSYNACVTADTSHHNEPSNPIINYMIAATSHTKKQTANHWPNEQILHTAHRTSCYEWYGIIQHKSAVYLCL